MLLLIVVVAASYLSRPESLLAQIPSQPCGIPDFDLAVLRLWP